jgi:hypothetical protein
VCTLSFSVAPDGYELFFSRDERRTRVEACPPRLERTADIRFLAPRDPEGGGTWLAANERGVTLALLNRYGVPAHGADFESRGSLVLQLATARSLREVEARLRVLPLARFRPFDLVAFEPGAPAARFGWDGRELEMDAEAHGPLCSSAVADREARAARRTRFAELCGRDAGRGTSAWLESFHREHAPARGVLSVCMHRADAKTVSLSRIRVTSARVALAYAAGSPCRARFGPELELARA